MRILYLARRPIPSVNANSVQIVKMCEAFARLGHEVTLVCHPGDGPAQTIFSRYGVRPAFRVRTFPGRGRILRKWRYLLRLVGWARRSRTDLLFGRDIWSLVALAHLGRPIVYEAHIIPKEGSVRWKMLRWLFERPNFKHLVCVTSTLASLYREQFPMLTRVPVIVAPNGGAKLARVAPSGEWPGRAGHLQVGFVGRPFPGKGIEVLADAAAQLPEVDFHIVGARRDELNWVAAPTSSNLHFHGYQPHAELGRFYSRFDVAAAPYGASVMNASGVESAAITSPLKLIEYMAAGLPTIVSDLPGVRDILGEEEVAVLVQPGDTAAFVEAVRRLAEPALRKRMGEAAHREYLQHHTAEARAALVLDDLAGS